MDISHSAPAHLFKSEILQFKINTKSWINKYSNLDLKIKYHVKDE